MYLIKKQNINIEINAPHIDSKAIITPYYISAINKTEYKYLRVIQRKNKNFKNNLEGFKQNIIMNVYKI